MTRELTFTGRLTGLTDGWHDGDGLAPSRQVLHTLEQVARLRWPSLDDVHAFPTFEGGATAERQHSATARQSLEVLPDLTVLLVDLNEDHSAVVHGPITAELMIAHLTERSSDA